MKLNSLEDLFVDELKDLYSAEKQLLKALPKMAKAATNEDLKEALQSHLEETEHQVSRLEEIMGQLEIPTRGAKCSSAWCSPCRGGTRRR